MMRHWIIEKQLGRKGYRCIAGLDEAGRGAWAGPLVAACVVLDERAHIKGIRDSKLLSPLQRERLYALITKQAYAWGVGIVSEREIDEQGIVVANRVAMIRTLEKLSQQPDYLLIDFISLPAVGIPSSSFINGEKKSVSIAAASIIAKVTRDTMMASFHAVYPLYGFSRHKGYGTPEHIAMLKKYGVSDIHRLSFFPMKQYTRDITL